MSANIRGGGHPFPLPTPYQPLQPFGMRDRSTTTTVQDNETREVTMVSSDGVKFCVPLDAATQSVMIRDMIDDMAAEDIGDLPLPNVDAASLSSVVKYAVKHHNDKHADLRGWDAEYVGSMSTSELFNVVLAANYLNIPPLLDLTCQAIADLIRGKTADEIRQILGIINDMTVEEEEEVKRENQWAFDD